MFCDDPVIGMIEVDADASWAPATTAVLEDLFGTLQNASISSAHASDSAARDWSSDVDTEWFPMVHADLDQLDRDLQTAYDHLLDRLMYVAIS